MIIRTPNGVVAGDFLGSDWGSTIEGKARFPKVEVSGSLTVPSGGTVSITNNTLTVNGKHVLNEIDKKADLQYATDNLGGCKES